MQLYFIFKGIPTFGKGMHLKISWATRPNISSITQKKQTNNEAFGVGSDFKHKLGLDVMRQLRSRSDFLKS